MSSLHLDESASPTVQQAHYCTPRAVAAAAERAAREIHEEDLLHDVHMKDSSVIPTIYALPPPVHGPEALAAAGTAAAAAAAEPRAAEEAALRKGRHERRASSEATQMSPAVRARLGLPPRAAHAARHPAVEVPLAREDDIVPFPAMSAVAADNHELASPASASAVVNNAPPCSPPRASPSHAGTPASARRLLSPRKGSAGEASSLPPGPVHEQLKRLETYKMSFVDVCLQRHGRASLGTTDASPSNKENDDEN